MSFILVVDDMALCREPIAEALRHHGYSVICADSGSAALKLLRDQKPDLVLLDVTMPDPDGFAVLGIMRRNTDLKNIPVILLTDRAEQDTVSQAVKCGVQGYLLKANFSLDILLARVEKCIGKAIQVTEDTSSQSQNITQMASSASHKPAVTTDMSTSAKNKSTAATLDLPRRNNIDTATSVKSLRDLEPIITKTQLAKLINDGLKLKPLAATVHNVIAVTGNANCSVSDVAKIVGNDQALSIRLLKLANSSAYSRGRQVDGIQSAVQRIGIHEVRQLVMALGVFDQYVGSHSTRIDIRLFWEHSLACGLIAAALAKACQFKAADECFLWGTLHDVGRVILLDHAANEYNQVCQAADDLELPLEVVERQLLFMDHCGILKHALEQWQFPHAFIVPVVNHHKTIQQIERLGPEQAKPAMIVALADRMAHAMLLGCSGNEMIYPFDDLVEKLGISDSVIEKIVDSIPDEARDLKITMLVHAASDTWPDYNSIVRARLDTKIRPLCVDNNSAMKACKLFLDCVSDHDDTEPPNLGMIYIREACEASAMFDDYMSCERDANCGVLPLIMMCQSDAAKLDDAPWQKRPHMILQTPLSIARFMKTAQSFFTRSATLK